MDIVEILNRATFLNDLKNQGEDVFSSVVTDAVRVAGISRPRLRDAPPNIDLFEDDRERRLCLSWISSGVRIASCLTVRPEDYVGVWEALSSLSGPLNELLDGVMVMVENEGVRVNRQALLMEIDRLFLSMGDLTKIVL